ncbi:cadmium-induced protein AS8 [Prunus yedoensis var. nudiflora]|uniref:Cadmium-induced protein AS8 n=1 Tax=Prunus yedoensis var. nudiflora TaxID=2094558 RepID=A0A314UD14_PRUYE|nr:cadmium-induced protein AS8 [Prunus yedoensis var. nudiflora]
MLELDVVLDLVLVSLCLVLALVFLQIGSFKFLIMLLWQQESGALGFGQSRGLLFSKNIAGEGWNNIAPCFTNLQREASGRFSSFKQQHLLDKGVDLSEMKSRLSVNASSMCESLEAFRGRFFHSPRESSCPPVLPNRPYLLPFPPHGLAAIAVAARPQFFPF